MDVQLLMVVPWRKKTCQTNLNNRAVTRAWRVVLFDYWTFHNQSSKLIGQKVSIDDRL